MSVPGWLAAENPDPVAPRDPRASRGMAVICSGDRRCTGGPAREKVAGTCFHCPNSTAVRRGRAQWAFLTGCDGPWVRIVVMWRGWAGAGWCGWGSWGGPGRAVVQICCKGAPGRDRPRMKARNINDSPPALRRDPGLCNRFGQTTPPRAPGGASRTGRRPRRAPRSAGRARGSVRRGRHRPRCRSRPGAFPVTRREGATICYDSLRGDGRVHHCASRTARQYRFNSSSCAGGRDLRDRQ